MSKHVLVISTSLRKGNSERLAQEFAKGAAAAGHQVEELTLRGKRLTFCTGCMACLEKGHCVIPDDAVASFRLAQPAQTRIKPGLFKNLKTIKHLYNHT